MPVPKEILDDPKISVIIPAFNARRFIGEALESVLAQTFPAHEIIVVDDGSTDGTGEFVRERYGDKVQVIWQENRGMGAARNTGIRKATGNIFQFLDADDLLLPEKFEVQLDFWRRNPEFDIVYCDHCYFRDGERLTELPPPRPLPQGNLLEVTIQTAPSAIQSFLVPYHVVDEVGKFDEEKTLMTVEDKDFWFRCALKGFSFGYIPKVLALTRRHGHNSTADNLRRMKAKVTYSQRLLSYPLPSKLMKFVHRNLADEYAELALAQLANHRWGESWCSLWKAWQHRCLAAKLAGHRDKALWLVDLLRWIDCAWKVLRGKQVFNDDPVLR